MSDHVIIRLLQLGSLSDAEHCGQYLKAYDPDQNGCAGLIETTWDVEDAMRLTPEEALCLWRKASITMPLRPDGQPNRPLTAYTIEVSIVSE